MENAYRRIEQLIDKSQSNTFTKIVIGISLAFIFITDVTMFALVEIILTIIDCQLDTTHFSSFSKFDGATVHA